MSSDTARFFELLRSGLWQRKADESLFGKDTDWQILYTLSAYQAVTAVVFDGMQTLPPELHPPRMLLLKWCSLTAQIEQANEKVNRALGEISRCLRTHAIPHVLLKGQGVASLYPNPLRRHCGDIDLYFRGKDFQASKELFETLQLLRLTCETEKHTEYLWKEVLLESHHTPHCFNYPPYNTHLQKMVDRWYPDSGKSLSVDETPISLPPSTFNALYLAIHLFYHLLSGGVGLRQVCDWALLLHHEKASIDRELLEKDIRSLRFRHVMGAFGYIAVTYLGLPPGDLPVCLTPTDRKMGESALRLILQGGNFGKYHAGYLQEPRTDFSGRLHNYLQVCRYCFRYFRLSPAESLSYPLSKIGFFTMKLWRK